MIGKIGNMYELVCDECGNTVTGFETFEDVLDYRDMNGWKSMKDHDEWLNVCPECAQASEDEDDIEKMMNNILDDFDMFD